MIFLRSIANSALLMTWASLIVRSGMVLFVLPLALIRFDSTSLSLWLFMGVITKFRDVMDFGLINNVARTVSYSDSSSFGDNKISNGSISRFYIEDVYQTVFSIYKKTSLLSLVILMSFSTIALYNLLDDSFFSEPRYLLAMVVHVLACYIFLRGNIYVAFINGLDSIALIKRWEVLFSLFTIISLCLVLTFSNDVLWFSVVNGFWVIVIVFRNRLLFKSVVAKKKISITKGKFDQEVKRSIIELSKRDFLSALFGVGYLQVIILFITSAFEPAVVNVYLLFDKLCEQIKAVSRAPVYTKIPQLSKLSVNSKFIEILSISKAAFNLSYLVCLLGVTFVALFGNEILHALNKEEIVFDMPLWICMSFLVFADRYMAMHNQLYLVLFNRVVMHIVLFLSMLISLVTMIFLYDNYGIYAIPVSVLIGNIVVPYYFLSMPVYRMLSVSFVSFEARNLLVFCAFTLFCFVI